jgi:hypothetical protein
MSPLFEAAGEVCGFISERDWIDAESIAHRQPILDNEYILNHLAQLCEIKDDPGMIEKAKFLLVGRL